jgi:3-methyladenine DNA glycosylase AlkC
MTDDRFLLKNMLTHETVGHLASCVNGAWGEFDTARFMSNVFDDTWDGLELKQRTRHITVALAQNLPAGYRDALGILLDAADRFRDPGWEAMCLSDFVEVYGLDDPDTSIPALAAFTKLASAEFAVRPFILEYPDRMYTQLLAWTADGDWRVRRLASEGCRPRLPWGMALKPLQEDPTPVLPVLEVLGEWQDGEPETEALMKHALRTLLKRGDSAALRLMGFDPNADASVSEVRIDPSAPVVGGDGRVSFALRSREPEPTRFMVDLAVLFLKSNGSLSPKVFKLKTVALEPGETIEISRKITFQQLSTRRVYPGAHAVEVQVNGAVRARLNFDVLDP